MNFLLGFVGVLLVVSTVFASHIACVASVEKKWLKYWVSMFLVNAFMLTYGYIVWKLL